MWELLYVYALIYVIKTVYFLNEQNEFGENSSESLPVPGNYGIFGMKRSIEWNIKMLNFSTLV